MGLRRRRPGSHRRIGRQLGHAGRHRSEALERIDVTVASPTGEIRTVSLVRKWTWAHEVLGLRTAQAVVDNAPAIPHLIADGEDERGVWLITPSTPEDRPATGLFRHQYSSPSPSSTPGTQRSAAASSGSRLSKPAGGATSA